MKIGNKVLIDGKSKKPKKVRIKAKEKKIKDLVDIGGGVNRTPSDREAGHYIALPMTQNPVKLKFVHMNDLHGYIDPMAKPDNEGIVGGIERTASEVKRLKTEDPEGTITLDGGDIYDGGFYSKYTKGEVVSKPFKEMGVEVSVVGNHDVTWGLDTYAKIAGETGAVFLGANIQDLSENKALKFVKPYTVMERKGVKIGILGLAAPETVYCLKEKGALKIDSPEDTAKKYIQKMKKDDNVDMVVVLSHLGYGDDVKLAKNVEGIDLIVGAHSHSKMEEAEKVGNSLIVQAGGDGKYLGDLDIVFDPSQKKIVSSDETLIPLTSDIKPDPAVQKVLAPYREKYGKLKNKVIGKTPKDMPQVNNKRNALINLFIDAHKMDSDIGVSHMWSIRRGFDRGDITFGDLFKMFPFDNELLQVKAKGKNVIAFLESGMEYVIKNNQDNTSIASGIKYDYNPDLKKGKRITSVTMGDKKYTREEFEKKSLTVSLDDYWRGTENFKDCKVQKKYGSLFKVLEDYITSNSPLKKLDNTSRMTEVKE